MFETLESLLISFRLSMIGFMNDIKEDEKGVSNIVATVILILIVVLLAGIFWGLLQGYIQEIWERITSGTNAIG